MLYSFFIPRISVTAKVTVKIVAIKCNTFTAVLDYFPRISDRGGGIRHDVTEKIWEYGFTSAGYQGGQKPARSDSGTRIPDGLFDELMNNRSAGKMHG